MEKVMNIIKPKPNPQQQLRDWQRRLRQECRNIERQIRGNLLFSSIFQVILFYFKISGLIFVRWIWVFIFMLTGILYFGLTLMGVFFSFLFLMDPFQIYREKRKLYKKQLEMLLKEMIWSQPRCYFCYQINSFLLINLLSTLWNFQHLFIYLFDKVRIFIGVFFD